jgi:hypothetical protein
MPDYVISVRAPRDANSFTEEPGPTLFLEVPDGAAATSPAHQIDPDDWVRRVIALAGRQKDATGVMRGDVLAFIHGYDNTVEIVLQRHRRLKADLPNYDYNGAVVSFDWPSGDVALAYVEDRAKAKMTAFQLVQDGIQRIARMQSLANCDINMHLLAHSTGAYVIREAFDHADDRHSIASVNWTVSQIALIGGDVSSGSMSAGNSESESIYRHCVRLTNYSNPFDEVLQLSNVKRAGVAPRVGRVGLPDDAPGTAVNVNCGAYYQQMIRIRPPADIIGYPSHSWHVGDPVFTEDLAHVLRGEIDRQVIPTRAKMPDGHLQLIAPGSVPVAVIPVTGPVGAPTGGV